MKIVNKLKARLGFLLAFIFIPLSMLQADMNASQLYMGKTLSETTAPDYSYGFEKKSFGQQPNLFRSREMRDSDDGWLDLPYGDTENAQKVPTGDGYVILILILTGYLLYKLMRKFFRQT